MKVYIIKLEEGYATEMFETSVGKEPNGQRNMLVTFLRWNDAAAYLKEFTSGSAFIEEIVVGTEETSDA